MVSVIVISNDPPATTLVVLKPTVSLKVGLVCSTKILFDLSKVTTSPVPIPDEIVEDNETIGCPISLLNLTTASASKADPIVDANETVL